MRIPTLILPTLETKPSWHNRAGRVDRSACAELTLRDLRHLAQRAANARAPVTITARDLHALHNARHPLVLQGDQRTHKSNAMKCQRYETTYNPNAGACRTKILGLLATWSQHITLVSPTRTQRERATHNSNDTPTPTANHWFLHCPQCARRARTLFLPLCTEREANDATLAQLWLLTHEAHIRPHMAALYAHRSALIERYAMLFAPRSLACRTCLRLRYGETKASRGL